MTVISQEIALQKFLHKNELAVYQGNIDEHVRVKGGEPSEYLSNNMQMRSFHSGAINTLDKLEDKIRAMEGEE